MHRREMYAGWPVTKVKGSDAGGIRRGLVENLGVVSALPVVHCLSPPQRRVLERCYFCQIDKERTDDIPAAIRISAVKGGDLQASRVR